MKTMLDIFKEHLPKGLEIVKVQDKSGCNQIKIKMAYGENQADTYLQKTCAPGHEHLNCYFSIIVVMIDIALQRNDLEMAKYWMKKQPDIIRQIEQTRNEDA